MIVVVVTILDDVWLQVASLHISTCVICVCPLQVAGVITFKLQLQDVDL
jgi:hypothetical protein